MKLISPPLLVIYVQQDAFSFGEAKNIILDTCVNLSVNQNGYITIFEFGKRNLELNQYHCVELFQSDLFMHPRVNRFDLLNLWFRFGFSTWASQNRSILRSTIVFRNTDSLLPILFGYEKVILEHVALQNGSNKVVFE